MLRTAAWIMGALLVVHPQLREHAPCSLSRVRTPLHQDREVIKQPKVEEFKALSKDENRLVHSVRLRPGQELTVALPRLYGGYVWKWQIPEGHEASLEFVGDDQFYKVKDAEPGDITYVAYMFKALAPDEFVCEFRLVRPLKPSDRPGPIYELAVTISSAAAE